MTKEKITDFSDTETKSDIRRRVSALRDGMKAADARLKSAVITGKIINHPLFKSARVICCYVSKGSEVATRDIIKAAWDAGKVVSVPKIVASDSRDALSSGTRRDEMRFFKIESFTDLAPGKFGVFEPIEGCAPAPIADLIIMPGVAFDNERNRAGYGKGYYDKYLGKYYKECSDSCLIAALAFDLQIVSHIPEDDFDIRPDIVITETREIS